MNSIKKLNIITFLLKTLFFGISKQSKVDESDSSVEIQKTNTIIVLSSESQNKSINSDAIAIKNEQNPENPKSYKQQNKCKQKAVVYEENDLMYISTCIKLKKRHYKLLLNFDFEVLPSPFINVSCLNYNDDKSLRALLSPVKSCKHDGNIRKCDTPIYDVINESVVFGIYQSLRRHAMALYLTYNLFSIRLKHNIESSFNHSKYFFSLNKEQKDDKNQPDLYLIFFKIKMYVYFITSVTLRDVLAECFASGDLMNQLKCYYIDYSRVKKQSANVLSIFNDFRAFESIIKSNTNNVCKTNLLKFHNLVINSSQVGTPLQKFLFEQVLTEVKRQIPYLDFINEFSITVDENIVYPIHFVDKIVKSFFLSFLNQK